jgi:hypothetical protein
MCRKLLYLILITLVLGSVEGQSQVIKVELWENIGTTDLNNLKRNPRYPDDPDVIEYHTRFEWNSMDIDNYGGRIHGWLYPRITGNYIFWLCTDDQGELWLSADDDPGNVEMIAYVKDSLTATSGWAALNDWTKYPSQESEPIWLQAGAIYYIRALWKEGGGGDHCQVAWRIPRLTWGGRTIIPGANLSPFHPVQAHTPNPRNGAVNVSHTAILNWSPSEAAALHYIYFGTNPNFLQNKGSRQRGSESFNPGQLEWNTTYYWRVDEREGDGAIVTGKLWSFTTANFLIVDDFESYNDLNPDDPYRNRIFEAWIDGRDDWSNGSIVGHPFTEKNIVNSGYQSMPFSYDNRDGNSEATLNLTYPRNWTERGVNKLTIWFRGDPANASERMYVALNGYARNYYHDPDGAKKEDWTRWNISLEEFAGQGVNLYNIYSITLGFSYRTGGSGLVFFDDIQIKY